MDFIYEAIFSLDSHQGINPDNLEPFLLNFSQALIHCEHGAALWTFDLCVFGDLCAAKREQHQNDQNQYNLTPIIDHRSPPGC
jgi:hypothetical protein